MRPAKAILPGLSRRHLLRGAGGVCVGLPLLGPMRAHAAPTQFTPWPRTRVAKPEPRIVFLYVPNGVNHAAWLPKGTGAGYALSPTLAPLAPLRDQVSVLSGLSHPFAKGGHTGGDTWLTGANLGAVPGADYTNTISIDQAIAPTHEKATRFPSLQLGDETGTGAAGITNTLSFSRSGTPLPAEGSPRRLFDRLFVAEGGATRAATLKRYAERRSILDSVAREAKGLEGRLGGADRAKVDEYLTSVRATEARVQRLESWVDVPKPTVTAGNLHLGAQGLNAHDRPEWLTVMLELTYLALATDTTRVVTYLWSREAGGVGPNGQNHHELSHHGGDQGMLKGLAEIDRFHVERLGYFLGLLNKTEEADGNMLDRTLVVFGSGMNSGATGDHSPKDLPLLVAGGRKLGLKHGQHLRFDPEKNPPLCNLHLLLAWKMNARLEKFQDATGPLAGLA